MHCLWGRQSPASVVFSATLCSLRNNCSASFILPKAGFGLTMLAFSQPTTSLIITAMNSWQLKWALNYSSPVESLTNSWCHQCLKRRRRCGCECFNSPLDFPPVFSTSFMLCIIWALFPFSLVSSLNMVSFKKKKKISRLAKHDWMCL